MPQLLPGAFFAGILTVVALILLRARTGKSSLSIWVLILAGIAAAYVVPTVLAAFPAITPDQFFVGAWTTLVVLGLGHRRGPSQRLPLWAGVLAGVLVATLLPPLMNWATGSFQRISLHADFNQCTRGFVGETQPREVANTCEEPITVGLCMPGEINPTPCAQSHTLLPGEVARFNPGEARLSSAPSNLDGLTIVACRPPARPSRMITTIGRGYEGVCLPPA